MKKLNILLLITLLITFISCDKGFEPPFTFSDAEWTISEDPIEDVLQISQGGYISFVDLSQGAVSHTWTIDSTCFLLRPDFAKDDSVYTDFIIPDAGNTTNDLNVHVLFSEPGIKSINLRNTFSDSVWYVSENEDTISSVWKDGEWLIDTTFRVDVYATLMPAFRVYKEDSLVLEVLADENPSNDDQAMWDTVSIEVGQSLTYVDMTSIGRPTTIQWDVADAFPTTSRDSAAAIPFFKLGTFVAGEITAKRSGAYVPNATVSKIIPLHVKVLKSSEPFVFSGKAQELDNGNIGFNVSGEILPFTGEQSNFKVSVNNSYTGFSQEIAVSSAMVSTDDATMIELALSAPIYNTDSITISYLGGNIQSADLRDLEVFSNKLVTMNLDAISILNTNFGFETGTTNVKHGYAKDFWIGAQNPVVFARSEEQSAAGDASMSYSCSDSIISAKLYMKSFLMTGASAPAGPYLEKIKVYIDEDANLESFSTYMGTPAYTGKWDVSNLKRGTWVTLSRNIMLDDVPSEKYGISVSSADNPNASGDQLIYFDALELIPLEARQ